MKWFQNIVYILIVSFFLSSYDINAQHTFSIVAIDTITGEIGSAGATCLDNGASIISGLVPGVGAINSQALVCTPENTNLLQGLGWLEDGMSYDEVLPMMIDNDVCGADDNQFRQYGLVAIDSDQKTYSAGYTGTKPDSYANHITGPNYAIQGNILLGPEILESMETGFLNTEGTLAEKLMGALQGANVIGADTRCAPNETSSAGAFLRVACGWDNVQCNNINLDVFFLAPKVEPIDTLQALFDYYQNNTPLPAPDNDECDAAIAIELAKSLEACTMTEVQIGGANESFYPLPGCDKDNVIADVWYRFDVGELPPEGIVIKAEFDPENNAGDVENVGFAIYENCRADAFYKACLSTEDALDSLHILSGCLNPNTTYYLKTWSKGLHLYQEGTYRFCVYELHDPASSLTVLWGAQSGEGDFNGGLNDWTTKGITSADAVWFWDEDAVFNSITGAAVRSQTKCNGAVVFHSDYLSTGGYFDNIPNQPYPTHSGELLSPIIDLSDTKDPIVIFSQHFGGLNGNAFNSNTNHPITYRGALFAYSIDSGQTWTALTPVNDNFAANEFSNDNDLKEIPIPDAADKEGVQLKFVFDGDFYFWMIDDVKIFGEKEIIIGIEDELLNKTNPILNVNIIYSPSGNQIYLQIQSTKPVRDLNYKVYDVLGKIKLQGNLVMNDNDDEGFYPIDIFSLSNGVYFIELFNRDTEQFEALPFVKN